MAADLARIQSRVTEILNACDPATFSSTVSARNKTRNATAIGHACTEAGLRVLHTIVEPTTSEFRKAFLVTETITHGGQLPERIGKLAAVEIQPYSGAPWQQGEHKDYRKIEAYRRNAGFIYGSVAHDRRGSSLSGFYDVQNGVLYFTGYAARIVIARVDRDDVATKVPDVFEPVVIKLAVGNCLKAGEGAFVVAMADRYARSAEADLMAWKGGKRNYREFEDPDLMTMPAKQS
jgi:hypothetical protein